MSVFFALFFSMADRELDLEMLQQQLTDLQTQLAQQRTAQAAAANDDATNSINAVESLQLLVSIRFCSDHG